ncbi:MAG: cell envelope integrity protein CreD [Spirochaetes bacterium]|nr:cell envelope integrity protein CreD [Spirochaetota bacterium]
MKVKKNLSDSVFIKVLFVGVVTVILLVPLFLIRSLITERQGRRDTAAFEVGEKWGGLQTVAGPFITVPYRVYWIDENKVQHTGRQYAQFLPDDLAIETSIDPEIRSRGIFDVVVYRASIGMKGYFSPIDIREMKLPADDILWDEVYLSLAITDMRGIREGVDFKWNGSGRSFEPGITDQEIFSSGINAKVPDPEKTLTGRNSFELDFKINGSEELYFVPVGRSNQTEVTSSWPDPSFIGSYLPTEHEIDADGFSASYEISYLSRSYGQSWKSSAPNFSGTGGALLNSAYGAKLFLSVDHYHKTMRSVKYAILFIILTFVAFFLLEVINRLRIHPFQYLMVGLAMSVFFLLLLSLSEHMAFTYSYVLASLVTIGIISAYSARILEKKKRTVFFTLLLVLLYVCLFVLMQLEDYALLLGSAIVFLLLGFVMFITRKIDWYSVRLDRSNGMHVPADKEKTQGRKKG